MNKKRKQQYDQLYMKMAIEASQMSHANRNKVGCIIIKDHNIISYGYNGMPSGLPNKCEHIEDGKEITNKEVLHAELNAICKAADQGTSTNNSTLYVTLSPCLNCSLLIIQSGIKRVIYLDEYRNTNGIELLKKVKIKIEKLYNI